MDKATKKRIAIEALADGETRQSIAEQLGVSSRTVFRWMKEEEEQGRRAENVIPMSQLKNPRSDRFKRQPICEIEVVEDAIASVAAAFPGCDPKTLGGLSTGLVRLLEYRRKIAPPSAAELAEQAIALGISPIEFVAELKQQWRQEA